MLIIIVHIQYYEHQKYSVIPKEKEIVLANFQEFSAEHLKRESDIFEDNASSFPPFPVVMLS